MFTSKTTRWPLALLTVVIAGLAVTTSVHADEPRSADQVAALAAAALGSEQGDGGTSDTPQEMPLPEDGVPGVSQVAPAMTLKTPSTTSGTISLSDGAKGVQVRLPSSLGSAPFESVTGSTKVAVTSGSADQVIQPVPGGFRAMTVIHDASAPSSYTYSFTGSAVGSLVSHPSGGIEIRDLADESVGFVDAPWARDATGRKLPTSYSVDGTTLTQNVDLSGATYPVTIDPRVSLGWFIYMRWNKREVRGIWGQYQQGVLNLGAATCGLAPAPYSVACAAVALNYFNSIRNTWQYAARNWRCMEYRMNYAPQVVVGWKSYAC